VLAALCAAQASATWAQDQPFTPTRALEQPIQTAQVMAGLTHTDNVARAPDNRSSDTVAVIGTALDLHHRGPELELQAQGDASYVDYLDHSFGSRVLGFMTGSALLGAPSDWFQFSARDTYGQLVADPFAAVTPDNLENVNLLSAGPAVNIHFSDDTRLTGYGLYSKTTYQVSPDDSHAITGGVSLAHALSSAASVSLSASKQDTVFDNPGNLDFDISNVGLRLDAQGRRTVLAAAAGYTQLKQGDTTSGGPLLLLQVSRKVGPFSTVFINAQRDYATSVDGLLGASGATPGITASVGSSAPLLTTAPFRDQVFGAGVTIDKARTSLSLTATYRQERYAQGATDLNRTLEGFVGTLTRRLTPTLSASLRGEVDHEQFDNVPGSDTEYHIVAAVTKNVTRNLSGSLQYDRYARSGSGQFQPYAENQIGARVIYAFIGP